MRFSNTNGIVSTRQKAAMKFCLFLVAFVVTALLASSSIQAQQYLGTLSGSVSDATGAKIVGASVTAKAALTNFETKAVTNGSGDYTIPFLTPDTYTVTVQAKGFGGQTLTGVVLTASATARADFSLKAAGASAEITVNADTELLDTTSANLATTMLTEEVLETPNIGRNPFVFETLAAGVFSAGSGGYIQGKASTFTNAWSGVAVQIDSNGSAGHNRLTLDGVPDDPSERFSGASYLGFSPSIEAVQEVKTQTGLFDAAYGHGDGVVANTVLKTGSNKYHGAAYYVFRNTYMDANSYQNAGARKPRVNDQWVQPGGVFDGPIRIPHVYNGRDKTFFTVAYEYTQLHAPVTYSGKMPTVSGINQKTGLADSGNVGGDFGNLCATFNASGICTSGIQIFDPNTLGMTTAGQRNPYPYNIIAVTGGAAPTVTGINSAGAALMGYYPAPNTTLTSTGNYISTDTSAPNKYYGFVARVDQQFSEKHHFDAKFFKDVLHQLYPNEGFPHAEGPGGTCCSYTVYRNNEGGSVEDSYVFNATTVLNARLGTIFHPFGLVYPGASFNLASLNISGAGLPYQSFPGASFGDSYASLQNGSAGQVSADALSSISVLLAKTLKSHSLRVGFEGNLSRYNVQNPMSGVGTFAFDRTFTQATTSGNSCTGTGYGCTTAGDDMAALLLGYPTSGSYANNIAYALSQQYQALFVQDDWRVSSKLTVNAGLRWDYESPFTDRYNRMVSGFCTTCTNPLQASVSGLPLYGGLTFANTPATPSRYIAPKEFGHIQPRFGVSYQITPKLVARGGMGLFYFNTQDQPQAQGFSASTNYVSGSGAFVPQNSLSNPFPVSAALPQGVNLPTGSSLGLSTALGQSFSYTEPTAVQPKQLQYSAGLQYQLPGQTVLQISYVGNKVFQFPINKPIDFLPASYMGTVAAPLTGNQITALQNKVASPFNTLPQMAGSSLAASTIPQFWLYGTYPEFTGVTDNFVPAGSVLYNSLQVTVNKRLSHHFEIQGNFTWEKIMDKNVFLNPQDTTPFRYQDPQPNLLSNMWGTYHFPEFTDKPFAVREFLGGWKLQGVLRASNAPLIQNPGSSNPGNPGNTAGNANAPGAGNPGYTYKQLIQPTPASRNYATMFNPCYLAWTKDPTGAGTGTWANASTCTGANTTPAFQQMPLFTLNNLGPFMNIREIVHPLADASLFKTFKIRGAASFEIRGEFFNVLNTPNFGGPNTNPTGSGYGGVSTPLSQANDARLTQLTARVNF
jgi:hypothetical protein